ncbi:MAG: succinate dehydrogenase cytochrome b subunit [Spirochaetales bacterium]|nr:succinate dehydrogenase cytochrome b subunit [Spirochaetales bacterium]
MQFLKSSLGRKYLMALTGLGLVLFLISHLAANLLVFAGPDAFNAYGHGLRQYPAFLLIARIGLGITFLVHVITGISLRLENSKARPVAYAANATVAASLASRTMIQTGILVFVFLVFHLAHYTLFLVDAGYADLRDSMGRHDTYTMVTTAFAQPLVAGSYILAMLVLGFHLTHGVPSLFQSLGLSTSTVWPTIEKIGRLLAILLVLAFLSIPAAIWLQLIPGRGGY